MKKANSARDVFHGDAEQGVFDPQDYSVLGVEKARSSARCWSEALVWQSCVNGKDALADQREFASPQCARKTIPARSTELSHSLRP